MSKAPQVDLDSDAKLRDYGDQTPFLPYGESEVDGNLVFFGFHDGYKGKAYRAKILITKSDTPDVVKVGKVYVLAFSLDGKAEAKRQKQKELRQFVAAVMKADAADENFSGNAAIATLSEASENECLEGFGVHVSSRDRGATDKDTKEPILDEKTGKQKIYTNRNYSALEEAKKAEEKK